jgi:hypothetical protein
MEIFFPSASDTLDRLKQRRGKNVSTRVHERRDFYRAEVSLNICVQTLRFELLFFQEIVQFNFTYLAA